MAHSTPKHRAPCDDALLPGSGEMTIRSDEELPEEADPLGGLGVGPAGGTVVGPPPPPPPPPREEADEDERETPVDERELTELPPPALLPGGLQVI